MTAAAAVDGGGRRRASVRREHTCLEWHPAAVTTQAPGVPGARTVPGWKWACKAATRSPPLRAPRGGAAAASHAKLSLFSRRATCEWFACEIPWLGSRFSQDAPSAAHRPRNCAEQPCARKPVCRDLGTAEDRAATLRSELLNNAGRPAVPPPAVPPAASDCGSRPPAAAAPAAAAGPRSHGQTAAAAKLPPAGAPPVRLAPGL